MRMLKGKTLEPATAFRNHMLQSRSERSVCVCVCFGARTRRVTASRRGPCRRYKSRRQPDELGRAKPQLRGQGLVLRLLGDHRVREAYVCSKQGKSGRLFSTATDLPRLTGCWPGWASGWRPPCACSSPGGACWGATVLAVGYGPELLMAGAAIHVARRPQRAWPPCWWLRGRRGSFPRGPGVRWVR